MARKPTKSAPVPTGRAPAYSEVIESRGLKVPFVPSVITPNIERPLRSGRYEAGERQFLETLLRPDDQVLDLGAGLGLVGATAAGLVPRGRVVSVEAHPALPPVIRETWALNGVGNAELIEGLVAPTGGQAVPFYLRADFWASSFEADSRPFVERRDVPRIGLDRLISEHAPTVICCDIEGGEDGLFERADLSGVRAMVIELHPKVYGEGGRARVLATLAAQGLVPRPADRPSTVAVLERVPAPPPWPPDHSRILVATCMKDEGPFILEWLAWHRAVGVTDFVVFTNDCTDGTDAMLDRLDAMGEVTHLPNPASFYRNDNFQPYALAYVQSMPVFRAADFFLSMDVDEFVNIHRGKGSFADLLAAVPAFDVLSISELNHGANRRETFERGWVTEQFPAHANTRPGRWKAEMGVKSLTRLGPKIAKIRNHRPDLAVAPHEAVWLDGSGLPLADLAADPELNGVDARGRRDLVSLEHFPLRSLDSFLLKMHRGDVVVRKRKVTRRYWRLRNRNESTLHDLSGGIARARAEYARFADDGRLMELHEAACAAHERRIASLRADPEYRAHRAWALAEAW